MAVHVIPRLVAGALALAAALGGCAQPPATPAPQPRLMACPHIPAPPPGGMAVPPAPVSGFRQILRPGHWEWDDYSYSWTQAVWMTLLVPGAPYWRDGAWTLNNGACVWAKGHFVLPGRSARRDDRP